MTTDQDSTIEKLRTFLEKLATVCIKLELCN